MDSQEKIKNLNIDEGLRVLFILIGVATIWGDELEKDYIENNDIEEEKRAKKIFIITIFISLIVYTYFAYENYRTMKQMAEQGQDVQLEETRFIGSLLVVFGVFFLLYYQFNKFIVDNPDFS